MINRLVDGAYDPLCSYYKKICDCVKTRQYCVDPSCCEPSQFPAGGMISPNITTEDDD